MALEFTNVKQGRGLRGFLLILPAVLALLSLGGVTARPALDLGDATRRRVEAQERLLRFSELQTLAQGLRRTGELEQLNASIADLRLALPGESDPLELHSLLRILCARVGFELDALQLGDPQNTDRKSTLDVVFERRVTLQGQGRPSDMVRVVTLLEMIGRPCTVRDLELNCEPDKPSHAAIRVTLGFFEVVPLDRLSALTGPMPGGELAGGAPDPTTVPQDPAVAGAP